MHQPETLGTDSRSRRDIQRRQLRPLALNWQSRAHYGLGGREMAALGRNHISLKSGQFLPGNCSVIIPGKRISAMLTALVAGKGRPHRRPIYTGSVRTQVNTDTGK